MVKILLVHLRVTTFDGVLMALVPRCNAPQYLLQGFRIRPELYTNIKYALLATSLCGLSEVTVR